jgi:phenylacetic acid degradation operon negative regulatory protein
MAAANSVSRSTARSGAALARPDPRVARWIRTELKTAPPKARSLIVTVWGDAIAPHGGSVWLSGLIRLLAPFGINERLTRTSVYRLAREGWLAARQDGRRSLYRLTAEGSRRFEHAYRRIYAPPAGRWDGGWELILAPPKAIAKRARHDLRKELGWEGFGALGPSLFVRPSGTADSVALTDTLRALRTERQIAVLAARDVAGAQPLGTFARQCWNLQGVATEYRRFIARFGRVIRAFDGGAGHHPQQCFVVRTLLIHEFRRVSLHDPRLPAELLPANWPGPAAYVLCRDFYRLTHRCAEQHLAATLETGRGALPSAAPYFYDRFGGL